MSYCKIIEYRIMPNQSFHVIRNCSGCGRKTHFINTKRFRVNANRNRLDVWLIYQCENCKHTYNLTIYERQRPATIPKEEYQAFLSNDEQMAEEYGMNLLFFKRNKAEVDALSSGYSIEIIEETKGTDTSDGKILFRIHNPYGLKIRMEKQLAEILGISASRVKKMIEQGEIETEKGAWELMEVDRKEREDITDEKI